MNKKLRLTLILLTVFILFCIVYIYIALFNTTHFNSVKIENSLCDNNYNNCLANTDNKLVQIGDKLYYNYIGDPLKYGTYEIAGGVTNRIYWEGFDLNGGKCLYLDNIYNGKILESSISDVSAEHAQNYIVNYYNIGNKKYEPYFTLENPDNIYLSGGYFVAEGAQYFYSYDADEDSPSLYRYKDDKLELILSKELTGLENYSSPIVNDDYMYFTTINTARDEQFDYYVCKYDMDTKRISKKVKIPTTFDEYYSSDIDGCKLVLGDKVYGYRSKLNKDTVFVTDLGSETIKDVFEVTDGSIIINGYENNAYIGVEYGKNKGIYKINNETNAVSNVLSETNVSQLYILDEKWLYFVDDIDGKKLYRVSSDEKTVEKVFG